MFTDPQAATLRDLETCWSLDDLARANALQDMREEIEKPEPKPGDTNKGGK